jgi:hypothetical protein
MLPDLTHAVPCRQQFHCWDERQQQCFMRPSEQERCDIAPAHRVRTDVSELNCQHTPNLCWRDNMCYHDHHLRGCNVRDRQLPVLRDGTTADSSTTHADCIASGHCWQACDSALALEQHGACDSACTLSTNHRCHIPPGTRVTGLGTADVQYSGAACLATHPRNCWDETACQALTTEAACSTPCHWADGACRGGQCYLGGTMHTAHQRLGLSPLGQPCAPVGAQSLDGFVCAASNDTHALAWSTPAPPDCSTATAGSPCAALGTTCAPELVCRPTSTCPACWSTAADTPPPCCQDGSCQGAKSSALYATYRPATTVFTWPGVHAPVTLTGAHALGPCHYNPLDGEENTCPASLTFPELHLVTSEQATDYNAYSTVTATVTHPATVSDSPDLRQHLHVGPHGATATLGGTATGGGFPARLQLAHGRWEVAGTHSLAHPDEHIRIVPVADTSTCPLSYPYEGDSRTCCTQPWTDALQPLGSCTAVDTMCTVKPHAPGYTLDAECAAQCPEAEHAECRRNCTVAQQWLYRYTPSPALTSVESCDLGCAAIKDEAHCTAAQVCSWNGGSCGAHPCDAATTQSACHATARNCLWTPGTASQLHLRLDTSYTALRAAAAACGDGCTGAAVLGVPGMPHSSMTAYYLLDAEPHGVASVDQPQVHAIHLPVFGTGTQNNVEPLDHVMHKDPHAIPALHDVYRQWTLTPSHTVGPQVVTVRTCPEHQMLVGDTCHEMTIMHAWTHRPNVCLGQQCTAGKDCPACT